MAVFHMSAFLFQLLSIRLGLVLLLSGSPAKQGDMGYSVCAIRKSQEEIHDYAKYVPLSHPSRIRKAAEVWGQPAACSVFRKMETVFCV